MLRRKGIHLIFCTVLVFGVYILLYNKSPATTEKSLQKVEHYETEMIDEQNKPLTTSEVNMDREILSSSPIKVNVEINRAQNIKGLKFEDSLYIPFSFLADYFGIYGLFSNQNTFKWYHVNPAFVDPLTVYPKYTISAEYLSFQTSNVPKRARVKCICGKQEVPITTQWDPKGYYYPTQVAQYGLSFLSKYHKEPKSKAQKKLGIPKGINFTTKNLFKLLVFFITWN